MRTLVVIIIYLLMAVFGATTLYSLFTNGSPDSLLRPYFPDPVQDVYITLGCSFVFFVLGFIIFQAGDSKGFRYMLELNADKIRQLRGQGRSEEEIVAEILEAMGSRSGYRHHMARKKLLHYLADFK